MRVRNLGSACAVVGLILASASQALCQSTVTIDFDSGAPGLSVGQTVPFDQASGGVTVQFSAPPTDPRAFSVQSDASTGWKLSQFAGKYLSDTDTSRSVLSIRFSQALTGISLTFATADTTIEVPSSIQLTAFLDSNSPPAVGTASARGRYISGDTFPAGTLSFNSGGRPFNLVEITIPFAAGGASSFFLDNIQVTTVSTLSRVMSSVSAASFASGGRLAPGLIASGFGQGLASGTASATSNPPPTTLANTTVAVKDSAGVERLAGLFYVGPTQINYLVPADTAAGAATATATSAGQVTATSAVVIDPVAPGLFTANFDGRGAPAAYAVTVAPDLTQTIQDVARCGTAPGSCVTSPIDLGGAGTQVVLTLYGTGIRGRTSLSAVTARIGAVDAEVQYAGAQTQFAGLDQVNVVIPRSLAGRGEVDLVITVDARAANTVRVNVR